MEDRRKTYALVQIHPKGSGLLRVKPNQVFRDMLAVFHPEVDKFAFNITGFVVGPKVGLQFFDESIPVFKPAWRFLG